MWLRRKKQRESERGLGLHRANVAQKEETERERVSERGLGPHRANVAPQRKGRVDLQP